MKKIILIFCILLSLSPNSFADVNPTKIDSLNKLISSQKGRDRIETLLQLSEIYREVSFDKSLNTNKEAIDYADQEGIDNMKSIILLSMGKTAALSGDFSLGLDYMNKAKVFAEKTKDFTQLCKVYIHMGSIYKDMAEYDKAIEYYNFASETAQKHNLPAQQAGSAISRATVYYSIGDYNNAEINYKEAFRIYTELNDSIMFSTTAVNLGLVYWQWNKTDLALEMMLKAKVVYEKKKQLANLGRTLNNIGKIYYQDFHDTIKALEYYEQSLSIREESGYQLGMAVVLANIGNIYSDKKQLDIAVKYFDRSLDISKNIGYKEGIALAYYYLGIAYRKNERYKVSNQYLDSSLVLAREHGLMAYFSLINEAKMTNYVLLNDSIGFFDEYKIYTAGFDSVKNELAEMKFIVSDSQTKLEDASALFENANETISKQKKQLIAYQIALVVLLIAFIWIFWNYIYKPKMKIKNKESNSSNAFKSV